MNGRKEQELVKENKIDKMLIGQPEIIRAYSYSFVGKEVTTKKAYIGYVLTFIGFLRDEIKLDTNNVDNYKLIRPSHINRFMEYIKYNNGKENGASIRATKLYAVSNFFEFLIDEGVIDNNPCQRIKPPKENFEKEITTLDEDEIKLLEENIMNGVGSHRSVQRNKKWINRDLSIVMLGCSTGLRVSAIAQINVSDINFSQHRIKVVEKGGVGKYVYIGTNVENQLSTWLTNRAQIMGEKNCSALFVSNQKKRITTECIRQIIKRNTYNINKNITPHKMRATCATRLYEKTGDIYLVQQQLGHSNIKNTRKYAKVNTDKMREAANILDLSV